MLLFRKQKLEVFGRAVIPIVIWSSVAASVHYAAIFSSSVQISAVAMFVGGLCAICVSCFSYVIRGEELFPKTHQRKFFCLAFLAGIFLAVHEHLMYFLFTTELVVKANIINYLWPAFSFLLSLMYLKEKKSNWVSSDLLLIAIAFFGAFMIFNTPLTHQENHIKPKILGFISQDIFFLFLALISSMSAAIYFTLSEVLATLIPSKRNFMLIPLVVSALVSIPLFLQLTPGIHSEITALLPGVFLGFLAIWLSNELWISAKATSKSHAFSSIAYFIPLLSAFILYFTATVTITLNLMIGAFLIVIANVILHSENKNIGTINASLLLIILFSGIALYYEPKPYAGSYTTLEVSVTVFAFLSAFLLNRVSQRRNDEYKKMEGVLDFFIKKLSESTHTSPYSNFLSDKIKVAIVDFYIARSNNYHEAYLSLIDAVNSFLDTPEEKSRITQTVISWRNIKKPAVSTGEFIVLLMLSLIIIVFSTFYHQNSFLGALIYTAFSASVSFVIFIIYEYDRRSDINNNQVEDISIDIDKHLNQAIKIYLPASIDPQLKENTNYLIKQKNAKLQTIKAIKVKNFLFKNRGITLIFIFIIGLEIFSLWNTKQL